MRLEHILTRLTDLTPIRPETPNSSPLKTIFFLSFYTGDIIFSLLLIIIHHLLIRHVSSFSIQNQNPQGQSNHTLEMSESHDLQISTYDAFLICFVTRILYCLNVENVTAIYFIV